MAGIADQETSAGADGRFTVRGDFLPLAVMVTLYLFVALYDLGSFKVPITSWQPKESGESVILDLGKTVPIDRIYYYCGINETSYGTPKFCVQYEDKGSFRPFLLMDKKESGTWKFDRVTVTTSRLRIVADPPGGTLNEIAVVAKGEILPLKGISLPGTDRITGKSSPRHLLDEQETFEYVPTFRSGFYFDEVYHARTAYEFLNRMEPYENTHPPLGKLLIASGISLFGMNSIGWRITGTLFGAAMLPVMYLFAWKLFQNRFAAFTATFLLMADFMHFTQTRIATIDVYATFFILLMYLFLADFYLQPEERLQAPGGLRSLALAGVCFGFGTACKWITLYAGVAATLLIAEKMYRWWHLEGKKRGGLIPIAGSYVLYFVIVPLGIYLLSYIPFVLVKGADHGIVDIVKNQRDMYLYHSTLKATHPFSSPWWSWPLDLKPVWFFTADLPSGQGSTIASFGNPAIWWFGIPAVLFTGWRVLARDQRGMLLVMIALAGQFLPWVIIPRLAFLYHYFSVTPFMIMAEVSIMQGAMERWPATRYGVYGFLCITAILFILFYPVLSGMPVARTHINALRWLTTWEF